MQFRCQSCGLVFSEGLPPVEALSPQQAAVVGVDYSGDPMEILCEALAGRLSVYNFCSVCVQLARYQEVWVDHPEHKLVHGDYIKETGGHELNRCSCGHYYDPPKEGDWRWINRAMRQHYLNVYYPQANLDLDLLAEV